MPGLSGHDKVKMYSLALAISTMRIGDDKVLDNRIVVKAKYLEKFSRGCLGRKWRTAQFLDPELSNTNDCVNAALKCNLLAIDVRFKMK